MEAPPTEDAAQVAAQRIAEAFDPLQVVLFGSRARGDHHAGSDTDLLVVLPRVDDKQAATVASKPLTVEEHPACDPDADAPEAMDE